MTGQALEQTAYLSSSPKNARRPQESIGEIESGASVERELIE